MIFANVAQTGGNTQDLRLPGAHTGEGPVGSGYIPLHFATVEIQSLMTPGSQLSNRHIESRQRIISDLPAYRSVCTSQKGKCVWKIPRPK